MLSHSESRNVLQHHVFFLSFLISRTLLPYSKWHFCVAMDSENIFDAFLLSNFSRAASQGETHQASDRNLRKMQLFIENREIMSLHGEKFTSHKARAH